MMNEKVSNDYFILNKYSELWQDNCFFDETGVVKLKSYHDVKHKETIHLPFGTYHKHKLPKISDYSFALDYCNTLYILDKKSKKIKKYFLDTNKIEELNLIPLNNPKSIQVGKNNIYVLDDLTFYCISKINYQIRRTIRFDLPIELFTVSSDDALFFFYEKKRNKIYKLDLRIEENNNYDFITIMNDNYVQYGSESEEKKEVVDMTMSDKLRKLLVILDNKELMVFNFDGVLENQISLSSSITFDFEPSSICVDTDHDFVFIGNKGKKEGSFALLDFCFAIKIRGLLKYNSRKSTTKKGKRSINVDIIDFASNPNQLILKNNGHFCDCSIQNEKQSILYLIHFSEEVGPFQEKEECRKTELSASKIYLQMEKFEWSNIYQKAEKEETENGNQDKQQIILYTEPLDSLDKETKWHKIVMDQKIFSDTFSQVHYFCTDAEHIPEHEDDWIKAPLNQNDFLLLNNKDEFLKGRFLYIKLLLSTNDIYSSPEFRSMKVYFGNNSYLDYLPAIYRENEASREFLEKFLSIFQTMMDNTYQKIFSFSKYLDSQVTSKEFLSWLASWLSISADQNWSNEGTRTLIERAPDLFKKRGTVDGIKEIILLYLNSKNSGKKPNSTIGDQVNTNTNPCGEGYHSRFTQLRYYNDVKIVENNDNRYRYFFDVLLNPMLVDEDDERVIRQIIEKEKPAHTIGNVRRLDTWFNLDRNTMLGINTILRDPSGFVLGKTSLSRNSILTSRDKSGQIEQSAIGLNTILT